MSEMVKSSIFVSLALVLVAIAGFVQYSSQWASETATTVGPDFSDLELTDIAGLEIERFNETTAKLENFEVRRVDGVWSLPSHDNYPADAETTHLAEAATALINMQLMGESVADLPGKHPEYGVVEPSAENIALGGMGTRVVVTGADGSRLAELIIGNAEGTQPDLRYVRVPGQDLVYEAKIDTTSLTTNLEDWVEADLLKVNVFDIQSIAIDDYSIDEVRGARVQKDQMKFEFDSAKPTNEQWSLAEARLGESARQDAVANLAAALKRLQIVDIEKKPGDLIALLKGESAQVSQSTIRQLQSRGFFIIQGQLFSNEGEVHVQSNDGVMYVIRFGEVAENTGGISGLDDAVDAATAQAQQLNRYVFISAQFNESVLEKPEMPEILKGDSTGDSTSGDASAGDANADSQGSGDQNTGDQNTGDQNTGDQTGNQNQDADLEAQKRQAEIDYNTKMAAYNQKLESGREKANELTARFADWYYIISDDLFNEIKVARVDVVETQVIEEEGYDLDDLRKLQQQGVQGGTGGGL